MRSSGESAVDGSCFLRLEMNVSLGSLSLPGHPAGWQSIFPPLVGALVRQLLWLFLLLLKDFAFLGFSMVFDRILTGFPLFWVCFSLFFAAPTVD